MVVSDVSVVIIIFVEFYEHSGLVLAQLFQGWAFEVIAGKVEDLCR